MLLKIKRTSSSGDLQRIRTLISKSDEVSGKTPGTLIIATADSMSFLERACPIDFDVRSIHAAISPYSATIVLKPI